MLKDIKNVISDYAIIGATISGLTIIIRPFVSVRQSIRDVAISFTFSLFTGLFLEYWDIPQAVKCGISGVAGLFGVRLYMIIEVILGNIQKDPDKFLDKIRK